MHQTRNRGNITLMIKMRIDVYVYKDNDKIVSLRSRFPEGKKGTRRF